MLSCSALAAVGTLEKQDGTWTAECGMWCSNKSPFLSTASDGRSTGEQQQS